VDRTLPPEGRVPVERPAVRWGLGDFFWVYFGGIIAGLVLASVGFAITHDPAKHPGALTEGLSFLGQFGGWIALLVLISRRKGRGSLAADFGLVVHRRDAWAIGAGVVLEIALTLLVYPLVYLTDNQRQDVVDELTKSRGVKLALIALVAGLIAPVCEELLFRGLLLRALRRRTTPVAAVAISALVFALAHPLLDPTIGTVAVVPALFALGAVSGVVALRRGNLSMSIFLHIGFNLLTTGAAVYDALHK
jgi:membrane protease YdiL (CAAX protease family)